MLCKASQIFFHILILNAIRWIMYNAQIENRIKEDISETALHGSGRKDVAQKQIVKTGWKIFGLLQIATIIDSILML